MWATFSRMNGHRVLRFWAVFTTSDCRKHVPKWAAGLRKLLWWGGGPKGVPAGWAPPAKTKQKGWILVKSSERDSLGSALDYHCLNGSSREQRLLYMGQGLSGLTAAAFVNRGSQLEYKEPGWRGQNVSVWKRKKSCKIPHISNLSSPFCIRHQCVKKCSSVYYLYGTSAVWAFVKA